MRVCECGMVDGAPVLRAWAPALRVGMVTSTTFTTL